MNKKFLESLLSKVHNPARVSIKFYDDKYYMIMSSENTNDTMDWYAVNSNVIEDALQKVGMTWCYVFETAPQKCPCIYMFFAKDISIKTLEKDLQEIQESLPEGSNLYFECASFSAIDITQYDGSITVVERELINHASDVLRVYEP